jgi:hypothetical protein
VRLKSNFAQVGIEYAFAKLYVYIEGIHFDIQTPTHWRMIGRSITAPPPVIAQQYSSTTFIALSFHSSKEKLGACVKNIIISEF